ncbi:hypothetical protein H0H87_009759 [Tephrocybe sp. NHM501043]|nr:hypothetical protein H0H87_009759 [Tephrocybe sp. NHM501043]
MDATALLAHILAQTRHNVEFLVSQKQISSEIGQDILSKLPKAKAPTSETDLVKQTQNLAISNPIPAALPTTTSPSYGQAQHYSPPPHLLPPTAPALPTGVLFRAKAIWAYNENGENPGDLAFRAGDIIDITAETNADWWTGRNNGREGLFPSNYVERLPTEQAAPPTVKLEPYAPMAQGAAGGVGFGVGSAVGSGLINSLF